MLRRARYAGAGCSAPFGVLALKLTSGRERIGAIRAATCNAVHVYSG
ncbi:hypothetical protein Y88_0298 [Novosphingobium nitrogenifigens DSM 19370]|uniref:Uncharacterized protein n=1 Tax=Novosphingobium nitrogenifigens DSM 19370 TaxID=983920 RepID=F1ZAX6_9SPHN|nr:hypothetical protein Y88_0298 [Novosphingobium nitrogenifigens DSM 19370]